MPSGIYVRQSTTARSLCHVKDLKGRRFSRLKALKFLGIRKHFAYWLCQCSCGRTVSVKGGRLTGGGTRSCGCLQAETQNRCLAIGQGGNRINLKGQRFGRQVVISRSKEKTKSNGIIWTCLCDCGITHNVPSNYLRDGSSTSCGCYMREVIAKIGKAQTTHGRSHTVEYTTWFSLQRRAGNKDGHHPTYKDVPVDKRWVVKQGGSFQNFFLDMGLRPNNKHTLGRLLDTGAYLKANCRWMSWEEQGEEKRKKYAQRTHCKRGHAFTSESINRNGACKACVHQNFVKSRKEKTQGKPK